MTSVNLSDFLSTKRILHHEPSMEYNDALLYFVQNRAIADIITYQNERTFVLKNISILEKDANANPFYQFSVQRQGDIVDNIRFENTSNLNVQLSYYIGGIKYLPEDVSEFVMIASAYNEFEIRITFLDQPSVDAEFKIRARYYVLLSEDRKKLMHSSRVETQNMIYSSGMCHKIV